MFYENENSLIDEGFDFQTVGAMDYPEHFHRNFELFLVSRGEYAVQVSKREYLLKPGDAVLVMPFQQHSYPPPPHCQNMEGKLLIFSPEFVPQFTRKLQNEFPLTNKFVCDPDIAAGFGNDLLLKISCLYKILALFASQAEFAVNSGEDYDLLLKSISYANENFKKECSLSDLASHLNYSYSYVSKHFSRNLSISFRQYISMLRLNYAHDRLTLGGVARIADLAYECGFKSVSTFNREFKRQFGCTPSELMSQSKPRGD